MGSSDQGAWQMSSTHCPRSSDVAGWLVGGFVVQVFSTSVVWFQIPYDTVVSQLVTTSTYYY